ncbi:MAG: hypothetical protein V3T07_05360 [Myxococcota bacterium]
MARKTKKTDGDAGKREYKEIFAIMERGGQSYWTRVGAAFPNRDGSLALVFNFLPTDVNARLQVRDRRPKEA